MQIQVKMHLVQITHQKLVLSHTVHGSLGCGWDSGVTEQNLRQLLPDTKNEHHSWTHLLEERPDFQTGSIIFTGCLLHLYHLRLENGELNLSNPRT